MSTRTLLALVALVAIAAPASAQDQRPYTEGTVWEVSYVKTEPGHFDDYLRDLQAGWKRVNDMAMEQGYIVSYKIISAQPGHPGDWDLMLLIEYPNWAAFDGATSKFDPLVAEIFGGIPQSEDATVERTQLRTIQGGKVGQELRLK